MSQQLFTSTHIGDLEKAIGSEDIPSIIQHIIEIAAKERASDIHIEPQETSVRLRIRVDGKLHTVTYYPLVLQASVVSRIKILANLKIDEQRKPQDGRIDLNLPDNLSMDIRVSTLPILFGEKVVMRLINKSFDIPTLEEVGLESTNLRKLEYALKKPNGIILNTGPTGSGKSTTLYSCLTILNSEDINILTLEDPVENQLLGLNQSQVKPEIGYSFASGLRNALRQDPDIMMVGEIRDKETLETAIESSLTGHLVLSTLHTNSAIETVTRLLNMQVPRYLITSTVQIIIAQRLVRLLCQKCMRWISPNDTLRNDVIEILKNLPKEVISERLPNINPVEMQIPVVGDGCNECNHVGYKGRMGIFEVVEFTESFKEALLNEEPVVKLKELAAKAGTVFLRQDGVIRVLQGKTSLEEVLSKA